jgi:hypothetical protein
MEGMGMQTERELLSSAMRYSRQGLSEAVRNARIAMRTGKRIEEFVGAYLAVLRRVHELQDRCEAVGSIWEPSMPIPFNGQIMDTDPVRKFTRQWAGFCMPNFTMARQAQQKAA